MIDPQKPQEPLKSASPEETRDRIIAAARDVIARKGKRGATTREIADVAGVNEATIFRHFGTKESLIVAVAKHSCGDVRLREVLATLRGPVEEDLFIMGKSMTEHLESMIDMIRWSLVELDYEKSIFAQEAWRPQTAIRQVVIEYMAAKVESGEIHGDPAELASVFMGLIFTRVIAKEKFPDNRLFSDTDYALKVFIDVFLHGVRSK